MIRDILWWSVDDPRWSVDVYLPGTNKSTTRTMWSLEVEAAEAAEAAAPAPGHTLAAASSDNLEMLGAGGGSWDGDVGCKTMDPFCGRPDHGIVAFLSGWLQEKNQHIATNTELT